MSALGQELRYAVRSLSRAPGFSLGVLLVLALGIGANTAMFTVLRATLFRPLAFQDPGQLVTLKTANTSGQPVWTRLPDVLTWQARSRTLEELAYYTDTKEATLVSGKTEINLSGVNAGANLFHVLGAAPALGRTFSAAEQQPGREHVVVLSQAAAPVSLRPAGVRSAHVWHGHGCLADDRAGRCLAAGAERRRH